MTGWGEVLAVEPQERVYYALAGNIAINNLFNARALQAVIGEHDGWIEIPVLDHTKPASFGSLELRPCSEEAIGQTPERSERARMVRIDTILDTGRVDLIKLDVEGMELAALGGAEMTIEHWRPVLFVEWAKCGAEPLRTWLAARGYDSHVLGINLLAIHQQDPVAAHVQKSPPGAGQGG
jgi:FkbM family methyltransferase